MHLIVYLSHVRLSLLVVILMFNGCLNNAEINLPISDKILFTTGQSVSLAEWQDYYVLVNFWATTCYPCVEELPELNKFYESHKEKLKVLGISMFYDPPNRILEMTQRLQITYPLALDLQGLLAKQFGEVNLVPTSFLITPHHRQITKIVGKINFNELSNLLH